MSAHPVYQYCLVIRVADECPRHTPANMTFEDRHLSLSRALPRTNACRLLFWLVFITALEFCSSPALWRCLELKNRPFPILMQHPNIKSLNKNICNIWYDCPSLTEHYNLLIITWVSEVYWWKGWSLNGIPHPQLPANHELVRGKTLELRPSGFSVAIETACSDLHEKCNYGITQVSWATHLA